MGTGSAKQWPETLAAHARLTEDWGERPKRRCPELVDWVAAMLGQDARFSGSYDRLAVLTDQRGACANGSGAPPGTVA